jgi:hypothetical protein
MVMTMTPASVPPLFKSRDGEARFMSAYDAVLLLRKEVRTASRDAFNAQSREFRFAAVGAAQP